MMHVAKAAAARLEGRLSRSVRSTCLRALIAAAVVAVACGSAAAQDAVFVSRDGSDLSFCSLNTPCRTVRRALELVRPGGTISVMDVIESDRILITKAVSIFGPGPEMVFRGSAVHIVVVAAPATALVQLSGFRIEGTNFGRSGILVESAGEVHVSNCVIRNVRSSSDGAAIRVRPSTAARVFVSNCTIAQNRDGIVVEPGTDGTAAMFLDSVVVDRSSNVGIRAGPGATIRLNNVTVTNNFVGLQSVKGGRLISFGNNAVAGNTTDGLPTDTIALR